MEIEYLIRSRNARVVRGVAAEMLSMCRRRIEQELLGVVSFSILGEPPVVLKKWHSALTFSGHPATGGVERAICQLIVGISDRISASWPSEPTRDA